MVLSPSSFGLVPLYPSLPWVVLLSPLGVVVLSVLFPFGWSFFAPAFICEELLSLYL